MSTFIVVWLVIRWLIVLWLIMVVRCIDHNSSWLLSGHIWVFTFVEYFADWLLVIIDWLMMDWLMIDWLMTD